MSASFSDPVALELAWSRIQAVLDESEITLMRTAFSPILREAYDYGIVLMDELGGAVAQSQMSMPGFIGTLPRSLKSFLVEHPLPEWAPGDIYITNDPWIGSGHLPDVTMIRPIFHNGKLVGFMGCIAHWADMGGRTWSADATELYEEGLQIPVSRLFAAGELNRDVVNFILRNVRLPEQVNGDMHAQISAINVGANRFIDLLGDMQVNDPAPLFAEMRRRSETAMRDAIRTLPGGCYTNSIEIDGVEEPLLLKCAVIVEGDGIVVDWEGSADQVSRGINESFNHAYAMTVYPIKCLLCPDVPNNEGINIPLRMVSPEGSIVTCRRPAPVNARQMIGHYLSQVVVGAMRPLMPDKILAECGSPAPRAVFSGYDDSGRRYSAALLLSGGMGGQSWRDGLSATPFPSNPGISSVEVIESRAPLIVRQRALRPNSGGKGKFRGGLGASIEVQFVGNRPASISVMTDRVRSKPKGVFGGEEGEPNVVLLNGKPIDPKGTTNVRFGDVVTIHTAGGGGYGPAAERAELSMERDLEYGYVSLERAAC